MIRSKNTDLFSATGRGRREWNTFLCGTGATAHLNAVTLNGVAVAATIANTSFYTRAISSVAFTPAIASGTATFRITGENQFGETVTEDLVLTSTTVEQTMRCYRRITSVVVTAISAGTFGAGDTISIGYELTKPKIPMLAKCGAGAVLHFSNLNGAIIQPGPATWVVDTTNNRYCIRPKAIADGGSSNLWRNAAGSDTAMSGNPIAAFSTIVAVNDPLT